jgi:hypothetical protein
MKLCASSPFLWTSATTEIPETSATLASFGKLDDAFRDLLDAPEADEFGPVRPTTRSVEVARQTLFPLVQRRFRLPEPVNIGTDHDGDLRIVWENGPRALELVVPYEPDAAPYFYYSHGDQYNLQRDLSFEAVGGHFNWLGTNPGTA